MKVISISSDRKVFDENSLVRQRIIDYGKIFEELHLVVFTPNREEFREQKIAENVFLYPTKSKIRALYFLDYLKIVRKIISKNDKENLVITTQDPFETGIVGLGLKFLYKLPLQIQVHTDFANRYFILHSPLNLLRFAVAEFTLSFADSVRVVSKRIEKSVHNLPEYIKVLPIWVDVKSQKSKVKSEENLGKVTFLTVARLEKEKDLETAIRAFEEVPDAKFIIVGEGSERRNLENLVKNLNLQSKIYFAGWQNPNSFYEKADVYVSTSLYEGYGMSFVEAAFAGLPLVLTDAGIARELFSNQFIIKQKDYKLLADKMKQLASDSLLRQRMGNLAQLAAERATISKEQYLREYLECVKLTIEGKREGGSIFKKNILLRYLVAGLLGATANIGLLYILTHYLEIFYIYSSIIAFLASIALSFTLQKFWTFSDKEFAGMHNQFGRYMLMAILGLFGNAGLMYLFVTGLHLWYILAQIIVNAFIAAFNFLMYKFFIFQKK